MRCGPRSTCGHSILWNEVERYSIDFGRRKEPRIELMRNTKALERHDFLHGKFVGKTAHTFTNALVCSVCGWEAAMKRPKYINARTIQKIRAIRIQCPREPCTAEEALTWL